MVLLCPISSGDIVSYVPLCLSIPSYKVENKIIKNWIKYKGEVSYSLRANFTRQITPVKERNEKLKLYSCKEL